MLKVSQVLALVMVTLITCTACKNSGHQGAPLAKTASVQRTAGSVAPPYQYEDTISLNGRSLTLTRAGGSSVISGTWTVALKSTEIQRLNRALAAITAAADADLITGGPFPVGGGVSRIVVGGADTFLNNVVATDGLHEFSADVRVLYDIVIELLADHGLDVRYSASV